MDAYFCCFNWLAMSENCFWLSQTMAKKNLFWPSCICLSRHWDFTVEICVPDIHCTGKHSQVAGDCKSKGDRTPLIFAKFDTAHCWHLGAWASEQTPGSVVSGHARGFCHFPDWALRRLFNGLFCHEQLLHFIFVSYNGWKDSTVYLSCFAERCHSR